MRWEDESYVKLYVRDTPTWKAMNWQARCLWPLLMRKLDKAGLMDCGALGRDAVPLMVELPPEVVESGLQSLERLGTIVWHGTILEAPKFEEAQEARASDVQRKREQRQRDKDRARAASIPPTAPRVAADPEPQHTAIPHGQSHGVTRGHTESQPVTPRQLNPDSPDTPAQPKNEAVFGPNPEQQVFEHWITKFGLAGQTKFTEDRKRRVRARLNEGYTVDRLKAAIDGCAASQWHREAGETDLELICRSASKTDKFIAKLKAAPPPGAAGRRVGAEQVDWTNQTGGISNDF